MTFIKKLQFIGILFIFPLVFSFGVFEIYLRVSKPLLDLKVLTGRVSGPNPMWKWACLDAFSAYRARPGNYSDGKTVNQYGFISTPEISIAKPPNTIRIAFLGGSSTAGTSKNLQDHQTWPWKTIEMIRKKTNINKKIEYINGALGGYTSFESYGRLWSRIRYFSPDIIVVYHGWNEMYYFGNVEKISSWRTLPDGSWNFRRKQIKTYEPSWIDHFLYWSQTLTRIRVRLTPEINGGEVGPEKSAFLYPDFDRRGLDVWRMNLKLLKSCSEIIGAKFLVSKQATLIVPSLPYAERKKCRYDFHGFNHNAHVRAFQGIYNVIDQEMPAESIIDVTQLSGKSEYFYDHIHPTPKGAAEIARIVSDSLITHINRCMQRDQIVRNKQQVYDR